MFLLELMENNRISTVFSRFSPICRDFVFDKSERTCLVGDDGNHENLFADNTLKFTRDFGNVMQFCIEPDRRLTNSEFFRRMRRLKEVFSNEILIKNL